MDVYIWDIEGSVVYKFSPDPLQTFIFSPINPGFSVKTLQGIEGFHAQFVDVDQHIHF